MAKVKTLPTQARLKELFNYDPDTGKLYRKVPVGNVKTGDEINSFNNNGYMRVRINRLDYQLHRIIWMWYYNQDPGKLHIDHINGCKSDNRILNLRLATIQNNGCNRKEVQSNNTSGITGVCWYQRQKSWRAGIMINQKTIHLGYFKTKEEAAAARHAAELKYFGTFAPIKSEDPISNEHASQVRR